MQLVSARVGGEIQIASIASELTEIREEVIGFLIIGACNIHRAKWLRYSNGNSAEGKLMKRICDDHGLKQLVTKPTRQDYLLDLVMSDLEKCKVEVVDSIADHCAIVAKVPLPCPVALCISRNVWRFKGAAWNNLKCALRSCPWTRLSKDSVDSAVN